MSVRNPSNHPIERVRTVIFEFENLLPLLIHLIETLSSVKGIRTKLSAAAKCQPSYLSQVLAGTASLSMEQLYGISQFVRFNAIEWEYVRELGILHRAGSHEVREDCRRRLAQLRFASKSIPKEDRLQPIIQSPNAADLMWYVSSWQISALMAAIASPRFQKVPTLAKCLHISIERVNDLIAQLVQRNFLAQDASGRLVSQLPQTWYLGSDSAGQIFRMAWLQCGNSRIQEGYREGFQKGGVFRCSVREFEELKSQVAALHRGFFAKERNPSESELIGYFGIELFDV